MKLSALIAATLALTGCAAMSRDPEVIKQREITRRYNVCMKQQLGAFGSFASPETRRKASESCQHLIEATSAS